MIIQTYLNKVEKTEKNKMLFLLILQFLQFGSNLAEYYQCINHKDSNLPRNFAVFEIPATHGVAWIVESKLSIRFGNL